MEKYIVNGKINSRYIAEKEFSYSDYYFSAVMLTVIYVQ